VLPQLPSENDLSQLEQRVTELRFIDGVEKVEHVRFSTGDQFWVRFNSPLDIQRLHQAAGKRGCRLIEFGGLVSKLPRRLSEVLWDGVTHVIVKQISEWEKITSSLGFEPDGIGKIARDLHSTSQIFMAMNEEAVHILYDYLGINYVPPQAPKPIVTPPKPPTQVAKPATPPAPKPAGASVSTPPPAKLTAAQTHPPEQTSAT
jgi:hypothetical protein